MNNSCTACKDSISFMDIFRSNMRRIKCRSCGAVHTKMSKESLFIVIIVTVAYFIALSILEPHSIGSRILGPIFLIGLYFFILIASPLKPLITRSDEDK